jgi:RNA polymerase sigma factor (sigma-70 family)
VRQATHIDRPVFDTEPVSSCSMPLAARLAAALEWPTWTRVSDPGQVPFRRGHALDSPDADNPDTSDAGARFARLVLPYLPAAYGLARSLTKNSFDAEDVVQEACLRAYRALAGTSVTNARAWLLTIVHNTAYTWLRKNRSGVVVAVDNLESVELMQTTTSEASDATPEAAVIAKADGAQLEAAMQQLPALFREVLVLREIEGLSYREIAEVTGTPIGTVMSRLARARDRLIAIIGRGQP